MRSIRVGWTLLHLSCLSYMALSLVGSDGRCKIHVFAPFTHPDGEPSHGIFERNFTEGFSNMAAAALAVEHFNKRNVTALPALGDLDPNCSVQMEIEKVFDSSGPTHQSNSMFWDWLFSNNTDPVRELCAIAGPSNDVATRDLSSMAQAADIPLVTTYSESIATDEKSRRTTSVFPDLLESAVVVVSYLLFQQRTNYIAFLHPLSSKGMQRRTAIGVMLDAAGVEWMPIEYTLTATQKPDYDRHGAASSAETGELLESRTVRSAVEKVKQSGFRTVLVAIDDQEVSLQPLADAVEEMGLNKGDHYFFFYDPINGYHLELNSNITSFLRGSAFPMPWILDLETNPLSFWSDLGKPELVESLTHLNPISPTNAAFDLPSKDLFHSVPPEYGAAFMYDAVMSIGIGACEASKQNNGTISGSSHHEAIRKAQFWGASGYVVFGRAILKRWGTRHGNSLPWVVINLVKPSREHPDNFVVPHIMGPRDESLHILDIVESWKPLPNVSYVYADGSNDPPELLRDPGDPNYLDKQYRVLGLTLMGLTLLISVSVAIWVRACHNHPVIKASQPQFLYIICVGVCAESLSVLSVSLDESNGLEESQLSSLCMSLPWFLSTGVVIVTSALFTKLLRVHRTLQFSRKPLKLAQIAWPMALLMSATLIILTLWTALSPLVWRREEVDDSTGDTVGSCHSNDNVSLAAFLAPLAVVQLSSLLLMAYMAFKTRDVHEALSESNWILILIIVQVEIGLIAIPVVLQLHDQHPNVNYVLFILLLLSFPWSTLACIFGPKIRSFWLAKTGKENKKKRGELQRSARVTGLADPLPEASKVTRLSTKAETEFDEAV